MNRTLQFILLIGFMVLYVVAGTLLHESGHILVAKILGYYTRLHYASIDWYLPGGALGTDKTASFYITLGGNILLDTISLIFLAVLLFRRGKISTWVFWIGIFFSMLIYRYILLSLTGAASRFIDGEQMSYGRDESEIAAYLHLSRGMVGIPLLFAACISCAVLFFVVLDREIRWRFLMATVVGGLIGYIGWLSYLGPALMP
jgi:hypothetical protein